MAKSKSRKSNKKSFSRKKTISNKRRSRKNTHLKIMKGGGFDSHYIQLDLKKFIYTDSHGNYIKFGLPEKNPNVQELNMISGKDDLFDDDFIKKRNEDNNFKVNKLTSTLLIIDKFIKYKIIKKKKKFDFKLKLFLIDEITTNMTRDNKYRYYKDIYDGDTKIKIKILNETIFQFIKDILKINDVLFNYKILEIQTVKKKPFTFSIKIEIFDIKEKKTGT